MKPGRVHWSGEGNGPFTDEPVTDDPEKVTCVDCLRVMAWHHEIKERGAK